LIVYPLAALFAAAKAMEAIYSKIRRDGTTLGAEAALMPFAQLNDRIGVEAKYALAERFGVE